MGVDVYAYSDTFIYISGTGLSKKVNLSIEKLNIPLMPRLKLTQSRLYHSPY